MNGKGKYKFKVIDGILSWKSSEMERYVPVSPEILTRVILLYEKQMKSGLELWQNIEAEQKNLASETNLLDLYQQLVSWMGHLRGVFGDTEPLKEKEKERWVEEIPINLN